MRLLKRENDLYGLDIVASEKAGVINSFSWDLFDGGNVPEVDAIIYFAGESHVDRSIKDPFTFARTNVMDTLALLQSAKEYWESLSDGKATGI